METTQKPVVLVMDDNSGERDTLSISFEILKYQVMTAQTTGGAQMVIYDNPHDDFVVIADMKMKGDTETTSSLQFIRDMKESLPHRVVVIVWTGDRRIETERAAIRAGAKAVLHKLRSGGGIDDEERLKMYVEEAEVFFQDQRESITDWMTGLSNAKSFNNQIVGLMEVARTRKRPVPPDFFSVVLVDLDYLKLVNEKHGYPAGHAALKAVANAIRSKVRPYDIPARLGGDEFGAYLPDVKTVDAMEWGEKLAALVRAVYLVDRRDREFTISISFGVGTLTLGEVKSGLDLDELLHRAEWDEETGLKPRRNRARGLVPAD